jgi:hypothetical protein
LLWFGWVVQVAVVGRNCRDQLGIDEWQRAAQKETRPPTRNGHAKSTRTRFWEHVFVVPFWTTFEISSTVNYSDGWRSCSECFPDLLFPSSGERVRRGAGFVSVPERLHAR